MHHQEILRALARWNADGFDAVVWDNASSHLDEQVHAWGMPLVQQPAYSPELNPAERMNEEIRRFLKGKTFATLGEKVLAVENRLRQWKANPAFIQRLCGYAWIQECIDRRDKMYKEREEQGLIDGRKAGSMRSRKPYSYWHTPITGLYGVKTKEYRIWYQQVTFCKT